jgi:flagellar motor switch protein FliG
VAPPIDFNDLIVLDDVALAKVFRAADPQVTLLALTGASRQLVDRILGRLPIREAKTIRRQMEQLGPTRLSDMERAQRQLAELAGQMADQGEIIVPRTGRFTMAV